MHLTRSIAGARRRIWNDVLGLLSGVYSRVRRFTTQQAYDRALWANSAQLGSIAHEWRATFDAVSVGIVVTDASLRITRLNIAAATLCGLAIATIPGRALSELPDAEPWKTAARLIAEAREGRSSDARTTAGDRHYFVTCTPASTTWPGGTQHFILAITDTTELARLQEKLRRAETMSALGVLIGGVCHEVRNPLFGISAMVDALEVQFAGVAQRETLGKLRSDVQRLGDLTRDLLEYGRPAAREFVPDLLGAVVREAVRACQPLAAERGVTLDIAGEDAPVRMNAGRLLQALQNLVQNAIEHSPRGGAVRVLTQREGRLVRCAVEDQGPGFRDVDLARLFEPFYTRRNGGTGLGLSIAQRVAEEHDGALRASDRDQGGARLELSLPVAEST